MGTNEARSGTGRIESVEIANGDVVVYDAENTGAWIQSDDAVNPEGMV